MIDPSRARHTIDMPIERVRKIDDVVKVRRALISVSDKSGLELLVPDLLRLAPDIEFYSTGGTHSAIEEILGASSSHLIRVSTYTGQPEMSGGLVKTLDFKIYLGILSETYNPLHRDDLSRTGAVPFDLIVSNLYPFASTVSRPDSDLEAARGNIDIGGPTMIRAAAKNYLRVAVVTNPAAYPGIIDEIETHSGTTLSTRFGLAKNAFAHTAEYDNAISSYLSALDPNAASTPYLIEGAE